MDEKISLYEEENAKIETIVKDVVSEYMNFEKDTYKELIDSEDIAKLLIKYPELNSYQLVVEKVNLYISNNREILFLKEDKINIAKKQWLLYFGG